MSEELIARPEAVTRRMNNPASGIVGEPIGGASADEREHFYRCPECGQAVDKCDLGQVFYHEKPGDKRLPKD